MMTVTWLVLTPVTLIPRPAVVLATGASIRSCGPGTDWFGIKVYIKLRD